MTPTGPDTLRGELSAREESNTPYVQVWTSKSDWTTLEHELGESPDRRVLRRRSGWVKAYTITWETTV